MFPGLPASTSRLALAAFQVLLGDLLGPGRQAQGTPAFPDKAARPSNSSVGLHCGPPIQS